MPSRFTLDRHGLQEIARGSEMRRFVGGVADEAAANVERAASPFLRKRATFGSDVVATSDGVEGRVEVDSPFWHWDEYGTVNMPSRAPIRHGVQQALNRYGGRLGER